MSAISPPKFFLSVGVSPKSLHQNKPPSDPADIINASPFTSL